MEPHPPIVVGGAVPIRALILIAALAGSAPAAAQDYRAQELARDADAFAAAMSARSRDIELTNQLSVLEARLATQQALSDIAAMRARPPQLVVTIADPNASPPAIDASMLASIPDRELAASNARVRAVVENRH